MLENWQILGPENWEKVNSLENPLQDHWLPNKLPQKAKEVQVLQINTVIFVDIKYIYTISPKKTPIAFAATTLPIELSAVGSLTAAILLANKSIWDVPKATKVIAVISLFRPTKHPKTFAKSLQKLPLLLISVWWKNKKKSLKNLWIIESYWQFSTNESVRHALECKM